MKDQTLKEMTIDSVGVSLMQLFIQHAQDLKKPWQQMSKHQQDSTIDAIRCGVQDAVKQAVELIAAKKRMHVIGTLEQITIKEGVRASIRVGKNAPGLAEIFERQGEAVALVVAHPGEELKGIFEIEGENDQRGLALGHEYKPNSDGEGMPETPAVNGEGPAQDATASSTAEPITTTTTEPEISHLYEEAVQLVTSNNRPSVSFLQRSLQIGSDKARALLDFMQINGVVTAPDERGFRRLVSVVAA
ncbi:MAG: DNA translocase FtsK [Limnobacter sp.]|uniref:DNA translocase FtsK n=1 Tax=Limnobacter sp. TaxID=2003368 RepID=UPI00391CA5CF